MDSYIVYCGEDFHSRVFPSIEEAKTFADTESPCLNEDKVILCNGHEVSRRTWYGWDYLEYGAPLGYGAWHQAKNPITRVFPA